MYYANIIKKGLWMAVFKAFTLSTFVFSPKLLQINQPKMHITSKVYHCQFSCTQNDQISEGNCRPLCWRGTPRGLRYGVSSHDICIIMKCLRRATSLHDAVNSDISTISIC